MSARGLIGAAKRYGGPRQTGEAGFGNFKFKKGQMKSLDKALAKSLFPPFTREQRRLSWLRRCSDKFMNLDGDGI